MDKVRNMNQAENVFQSKIMQGMIITLLAGGIVMLIMAIVMFVFAGTSNEVYLSFGLDDMSAEARLKQSKLIITGLGIVNICVAAVKFTELFAAVSVYKKYPKSTGFTIIKITAVIMSAVCCLLFAAFFIGAFVSAITSGYGYKLAAFKSNIIPAVIIFFPALKFIALSVTVTSIKKQITSGILLLIISTAVLSAGYLIFAVDVLLDMLIYYALLAVNIALIFLVFGSVNIFIFLMAKNYVKLQVSYQEIKN